jgi:uncharacterized protein (TIGR02996 family)
VTSLEDTVRCLLQEPREQTYRLRLLDPLCEECADPERAALDLVLAHPENDGPRRLYAEWCERNGRPQRARAILLGVDEGHTLSGTCRRLRDGGYWGLPADWPELWGVDVARGFVQGVTMLAQDWVERGHEITRDHPVATATLLSWPVLDSHPQLAVPGRLRVSLAGLRRVAEVEERDVVADPLRAWTNAVGVLLELEFPTVQAILPPTPVPAFASAGLLAQAVTRYSQDLFRANYPGQPVPKVVLGEGPSNYNYAAAQLAEPAADPRFAQIDAMIGRAREMFLEHLRTTASNDPEDQTLRRLRETLAELTEYRARAASGGAAYGLSDVRRAFDGLGELGLRGKK